MNTKKMVGIAIAALITLASAGSIYALRPPHDQTSGNNITCGSCHKTGAKIRGYQPFCISECHNTLSTSNAKRKPLDLEFASNRFGTFTNQPGKGKFSHAWATLPNYSAANRNNKNAGTNKLISVNQVTLKGVAGTNTIICSKCHYAHGMTDSSMASLNSDSNPNNNVNKPFIRVSTKGDYICFQCHEARDINSVRSDMQSAVIAGSKYYSHPVQVSYSVAKYRKSQEKDSEGANLKWEDWFEASPTNEPGWNESARPRLYTSYDGSKKDAVVCSSCHGPMHSADSNPYTLDNITSFSKGVYTTSAGNLLRRYPMSNTTWGDKTCTACHKVKTHQGYQCNRCHEPHKRKGDNNIYLIRTSIQTPYAKQSVYFTSTSQMAKRWGIFSSPNSSRSTAICQVCHRTKSHHRAYSTVGADREHKYLGNNKFQNCVLCHPHNAAAGGFAQTGGCTTCHEAPPADTYGKHGKHVGNAGYKWMPTPPTIQETLNDTRSASDYGFSCGRCHNPWTPYTASANGKNHYGTAPGTLRGYTADIGFGQGNHPLPTNGSSGSTADYQLGSRGTSDTGPNGSDNYRWSTPASGSGTCRNLYCHGQFYNGYTSNNPDWLNSANPQTCGKCHGAKRSDPPGKTAGTNWGAHQRHVGNGSEQYNSGGWKFGCNACHYPTTMSSLSSIDDRSTHVDGRVTLEFNGGGYGDANSRYDGFVDYTSRKPKFTNPFSNSKPAYKTCGLIYCHSDGSRTQGNYSTPFNAGVGTGTARYPNWSSAGKAHWVNSRCSKCHGNSTYLGITAAMPGVTSKGNSHSKHITNGFLCNVCHSGTVNTDNKSILSTTLHVNKAYDVNVISKYVGGAFQYNADKTCSNVECHGNRLTPAWGGTAVCKDCHFKSTSEVTADEGYNDSYTWRNMTTTSSMPRIYSSEWVTSGHGRSSSTKYQNNLDDQNKNNLGAGKGCTTCHKASGSKSHQSEMTNNPYRVYTAPSHIDDLCQQCHASSKPNAAGGGADKKVLTHYTTGWGDWGNAKWPFMPKCIDCHDPHGDNNRYMVQKFINFTGSDSYGKVANSNYVRQVTFSTVGGGQMNWSSYVNSGVTGICQRCHNTQADMNHFNKATYNAGHNAPNRCTGCHKHDTGFKGLDCGQCHNFPPTLSGKHSFHVGTSVNKSYVDYDLKSTKNKYAYGCGKCHNSNNHIGAAQNVYTAEVVFDSANYPKNDINGYIFGAKSSIDDGASTSDSYKWASTKGTCQNLYCHGEFAGGNTGNDPLWYGSSACGNCHGATQASAPSGGAHGKHVNVMGYDCRNCHDDTVDAGVNTPPLKNKVVHVDGKTQYKLYTAWSARIGGAARYNGAIFGRATTEVGSATYGFCQNIYCHSKGTNTTNPYNVASAYPNYTAKWGSDNLPANPGEKCSYCHGSRKTAGGYAGITSAMPNYPTGSPKINSHKKHVVDNGFSCYACHANTVDSTGRAISASGVSTYHVNKAYDVSFPSKYDAGGASYASSKCSNIKCHGGRLTPAWGDTAINCTDCHYRSSAGSDQDVMDYTFRNYTDMNSVPKIYSTEWKASGHGKTGSNYNRTNNAPAGKICNTCHVSSVKHNTGSNFFRLTGLGGGTDPSSLCRRCHGTTSGQLQSGWFGNKTGIQGHTQQILSAAGYANLTTWRFTPKCIDCHDPHGDSNSATAGNIAMIRNTYIYNDGSDSSGKPNTFPNISTATFVKYTGTNSFDNNDGTKGRVCAVCHKRTAHNGNGTGHTNAGLDCRSCHKHKQGFNPSGCTGCHGDDTRPFERSKYAPPKGPSTFGWTSDDPGNSATWGIHQPHAYNPKGRPGFNNQTGFACSICHGPVDGRSEAGHPGSTNNAGMNNMTSSATTPSKRSKWAPGADGKTSVVDDTCWNTGCHTPRAYTRTWKKPVDCDDCHGYTKGKGAANRVFNLQTTQSHKIHINYTGIATPPASWKKNYNFACKNCHYDWVTNNNYTTHYNSLVNITSNGPVNTVGAAFYTRGRAFKGFTSGNESLGTCSKTYCHGNFTNGTTTLSPNWKKGVTTLNCGSCHKAKTAKVSGWSTGTVMPAPHPTHVNTATYNFTCARCHNWTVTNNTTVQFTYSTHVNTRKDVNFDNTSGGFDNSTKMCQNNYCHSSGQTVTPRTVSNYTAEWDKTVLQKTGAGRLCAYCHGNKTFGGITAAMPNYANQAHAKHARNATGENFRCYVCHAGTVNSDGTINYAGGKHVNKFKNISIIASYKSGQTMYSTTVALKKTCKNIKCHGGRTTPLWTLSTGINCMDCHKSTSGDTDKRIQEANIFQSFSETAPKIYSTAWATRGHGRPTAEGVYLISGNSPANKTCTNCHGAGETRANGLATKHGTGNNPFRLITAPGRPNVLCESCHGTNATNPGKGVRVGIQTHASSVSKQGQNFDIKCIDCHDPHGDNNIYMVHSTVVRPNNALSVKSQISNLYGNILINATTARNVDFVNNVYTSDYGKKTQATKICQTCHRETQKPRSSTVGRFRWNGSQDNEHGTTKCTSCHSHDQGFKGVRCDGCHGNPPTGVQTILSGSGRTQQGNERPSGTSASEGNTAGAHLKHVQVYGTDSVTCSYCHQGGMYNTGSKNLNIDIGFRAFAVYSGYTQNYNGQSAVKTGFYGYSGYGVGSGTNQKCNNMKCHGGGSWLTASYGAVTAPTWTAPNSATCGKCHGAKKAAGAGSWPTTYAHPTHAGTGSAQANLMCNVCHATTVISNNTTLDDSIHVNGRANIGFGNEVRVDSGTSAYSDDGNYVNNGVAGKCTNTYCHSKGTYTGAAPYNNGVNFSIFTAGWGDSRGGYRKASATTIAKCNYCHGNKNYTGILASMPDYADGSPKINKHQKHVRTYNFLCTSCHLSVTVNNSSIDGATKSNHINRAYNVNFNTNTRNIDNSLGRYTSVGSWCRNTYCHSKGTDRVEPVDQTADFAVYTAKWGDASVGYKTGANQRSKCNYCHGNKGAGVSYAGMTSAMPNYANTSPKANRHQKHVITYGFTCTRCHVNVTVNNTSIDASGGAILHVNKKYNVNFNNNGVIDNIQATYTLQTVSPFSKCKNTYCHSRGTDSSAPFNTRTSFANFTARWGDSLNSYKQTAGLKAKCNYCHGNRLYAGMTSSMPNYSTEKAKPNSHKRHVVGYGFTCKACHKYVTNNNSSIDVAGGISRHANKSYNVDFSNSFNNNTGSFTFIGVGSNNKCKNTYCHSRGTDFTKPYSTRTSFANFTARWGENLGSYKKAAGTKAKCNYCHGNRAYSGTTSAMPNYSGDFGAVKAKANSHRAHVIGNGYTCKECHYGVVPNNTSISDMVRHANAFYNISFAPGRRGQAGKMYSSVWSANGVQGTGGGTCMRTSCHGTSTPKWGSPSTADCKSCHFTTNATEREDDYGRFNSVAAKIYSTDWGKKGHGAWNRTCNNCHDQTVAHRDVNKNPFRLFTSDTIALCMNCHGTGTQLGNWNQMNYTGSKVGYKTHSKANAGKDASWNNFSTKGYGRSVVKCVDCHDPHGDKNRKMIQSFINHTGSDRFGRPTRADFSTVSSAYSAQMTFTTFGGNINWSSFANTNVNNSICRRCHTPIGSDGGMGNDSGGNMTKGNYAGAHKSHQPCTGCHKHDTGFKGGGESSGDASCNDCHSDLFNPMNSGTNSYHHVMQNTSATGANKYPIGNNLATVNEPRRRCLMCHVDHNIFKDQAWPAQGGRAGNLRANINAAPSAVGDGRRSDWSGTDPYGGICLSCHTVAQTKNKTKQFDDGSTKTLRLFTSMYRNTPHNYTAIGVIATGGSRFKANCVKCHNDTMQKTKFVSATTTGFGVHDSKLRRLNSKLGLDIDSGTAQGTTPDVNTLWDDSKTWTGNKWNTKVVTITTKGKEQTRVISGNTGSSFDVSVNFSPAIALGDTYTIGDPPEEDYCYNCHSTLSNPNASDAKGNKDYYGMVSFVNKKALKMEQTFNGDFGAPSGEPTSSTNLTDTTKSWGPSQWVGYIVKITSGTGSPQERTITVSGSNYLTVTPAWSGASSKWPDAASKYAIGNPFRHRIQNFGGLHRSDEAIESPSGVTANGWPAFIGSSMHVGCADCHNPHSQRKPGTAQGVSVNSSVLSTITTLHDTGSLGGTKSWSTDQWRGYVVVAVDRNRSGEERMILSNTANKLRVGAPFGARMTGVYYNILPKARAYVATQSPNEVGNMLNGPNHGQWGVKVTKWDNPIPNAATAHFNNMSAPTFSKVTTLFSKQNKVYELCFKCHSKYGWGTSGTPFNVMDGAITAFGTYGEGASTDISAEINPNNLAHHAIVAPGKNQPIVANYNDATKSSSYNIDNWPYYSSTTAAHTLAITTGTATLAGGAALPSTVIPGWYVWITSSPATDIPNNNVKTPVAGTSTAGWFQITEITSSTSFKVTPTNQNVTGTQYWAVSAGLGNAFVPPYGPWSVIGCPDCHDTDAAGDPSGPHGSGRNWLLRKMESQKFPWFNGINVITVGWGTQGWAGVNAPNTLCLNCHRADVYGNDANAPNIGTLPTTDSEYFNFSFRGLMSRQHHSPEGASANARGYLSASTFKVVCMNCHAGTGMGEIHGTNMGASVRMDYTTVVTTPLNTIKSYRGKRFLTGGAWSGVERGKSTALGTCYYGGASATINSCSGSNDGSADMGTMANYDYESLVNDY